MTAARPLRALLLGLAWAAPAWVGLAVPVAAADDACAALIEQSNAQIEAMRQHAASIAASLDALNAALARAESQNAEQAREIERLQDELRARRVFDPEYQVRQRREFFLALRRQLPLSALYEVQPDHLVIANDPVFIFGKGEIGAEGEARLAPLAAALQDAVTRLPDEFPWRLRIEGHTDSRPLRTNPRFDNNWELSAARALSVLEFLVASGLPEHRLVAVGLADTQLRDPGTGAAAHRRNRRIELHLSYTTPPKEPAATAGDGQ